MLQCYNVQIVVCVTLMFDCMSLMLSMIICFAWDWVRVGGGVGQPHEIVTVVYIPWDDHSIKKFYCSCKKQLLKPDFFNVK